MQIGAILTLSDIKDGGDSSDDASRFTSARSMNFEAASVTILGQNLVDRSVVQLQAAGVQRPIVVPNGPSLDEVWTLRFRSSRSVSAWDKAVAHWVQKGVDALVLLRAGCYFDLDFSEVIQFHTERNAAITQVYAPSGRLDIAIVDTKLLQESNQSQ